MINVFAVLRRPPVIAALGAALLLGSFGMVADEVIEGDTVDFDRMVTLWFRDNGDFGDPWGPTWVEEAMRDFTALGSFPILGLIVIATVIYMLLERQFRSAAFVSFAVISGTILSTVLKTVFDRPRPDVEAATRVFTASFPSGHATVSAVVYLTLGALLAETSKDRRLRAYLLGLGIVVTLVIGFSRVYLGVHYPTDVLAGWALGSAWALLCWVGIHLVAPRKD